MRIYTVHIDPISVAGDREAVLVREGFCWPAAVFTVLWALYYRLWGWALILLAVGAGLGAAVGKWSAFDPVVQTAVQIGYVALVGYSASDWRRRSLARRGYVLTDVVTGPTLAAAERRFFDRQALGAR